MESKRNMSFWYGMATALAIIGVILATIIYSEELILYSGITTFYSLVLFILFFIIKEIREKNEETKTYIAELHSITYQTDQIKNNLKYFKEAIHSGQIPVYSISSYDFELPIAIQKIQTRTLADLQNSTNDKIESLNEIREGLSTILINNIESSRKKQAQALGAYVSNIGFSLDEIIDDIDARLEDIRRELRKWNM